MSKGKGNYSYKLEFRSHYYRHSIFTLLCHLCSGDNILHFTSVQVYYEDQELCLIWMQRGFSVVKGKIGFFIIINRIYKKGYKLFLLWIERDLICQFSLAVNQNIRPLWDRLHISFAHTFLQLESYKLMILVLISYPTFKSQQHQIAL